MFEKLAIFFKNKDLRAKALIVLGIFVVFRVVANIPIPGIGAENLRRFFAETKCLVY